MDRRRWLSLIGSILGHIRLPRLTVMPPSAKDRSPTARMSISGRSQLARQYFPVSFMMSLWIPW
ncbi:hypothetical protein SAMN05421783_108146 [Thiocapsa roseopersicina]|uniref:Uncharacterized protein n=1 Tax=Thiocapsa roseopersicina TaxID=1058 RepID=A0A1H2WD34_THIRO|nr:hypothetical protein SAMN05421783_108146 [Thiocapsa roseopersicina]